LEKVYFSFDKSISHFPRLVLFEHFRRLLCMFVVVF